MQLDRTSVVIRARSLSEIGDLAMILLRRYPAATVLGLLIGLIPWAICNSLLLGWIPVTQFVEGFDDEEMVAELARYVFLMTALVILQAPVAGVITTTLIGRAVFEPQVTWQSACADVRQMFWRWFWVLGVLRGPLPLMLILASNWGQETAIGREILVPIAFLAVVGLQRGRRPFMPEILLLERCPLRTQSPAVLNVRRRSAALHDPLAGELLGRFLTVSMMLGVLCLAALYTLLWARGVLLGRWDWSMTVYLVFVPAALWAAAGLSVLIRFLSYLDTRIRLEGWEVDLAMRAEAQRQFGESLAAAPTPRQRPRRRSMTIASAVIAIAMAQVPAAAAAPVAQTSHFTASQYAAAVSPGDVTIQPNSSSTWYDPQSQQLRPLQVQTQLPETKHRDSRWLAPAKRVSGPATPAGGGGTWSKVFGWMLLSVLALALIWLLIFIFNRVEPDAVGSRQQAMEFGRGRLDQQTMERMDQLPAEVRRNVNLRDEAERLMHLGRLDEAIVLLFGHQLLLLDRCGFLRLARGKTNGRYLRETRRNSPEAHPLVVPTVAAFEASYFGRHAPAAEQFEKLWADNATLESIVHAKLEVSP